MAITVIILIWMEIGISSFAGMALLIIFMLFPSIHFYCSDASYNIIHGPEPGVCEGCDLIPKGTNMRDEP
jgi:hypothetical protein